MHSCNYCHTSYEPRPQVKKPRACDKEECQLARQRDNEKSWRERNKAYYGKEYYEQQRIERDNSITCVVDDLVKCLEVGKTFLDEKIKLKDFNLSEFKKALGSFFSYLGMRRTNKFWMPISQLNCTTS